MWRNRAVYFKKAIISVKSLFWIDGAESNGLFPRKDHISGSASDKWKATVAGMAEHLTGHLMRAFSGIKKDRSYNLI